MSYRSIDSFILKGFPLKLQPLTAWVAILALVLWTILLIGVSGGTILNLTFPLGAFAVGVLLFFRAPILYLGFTWWLCFLTPLIRRVSDYRSGFTDPSPILVSPYLVILITLITLYQELPNTHRKGGLPFIICLASIFYAILLGIIQLPIVETGKAGLEWIAPPLFGFHIFANWRDHPSYRKNIQSVFFWGPLVMAIYGIFQYLIAPGWEKLWLIKAEFITGGLPEPLGMDVWGTINDPYAFGLCMMASLILLLSSKRTFYIPTAMIETLTLLLTNSRTSWGCTLLAMGTLLLSAKSKFQIRLITIILILAVFTIPLVTLEPFNETISSRLATLTNLENDFSRKQREEIYLAATEDTLTRLVGQGLPPQPGNDSTILDLFNSFGFPGAIVYFAGWFKLIFDLFRFSRRNLHTFTYAAFSIVIGFLFALPLDVMTSGIAGIILWSFLGMGLASGKYNTAIRADL